MNTLPRTIGKRDFALFFGPVIALLWKWLRRLSYTFPPWTVPLLDQVKCMRNEVHWERSKQHSQVASPNQGVLGIKALGTDFLCPESCVCSASLKKLEFFFHHDIWKTKPCRGWELPEKHQPLTSVNGCICPSLKNTLGKGTVGLLGYISPEF